ncbi:MAG: glycosyl transferase family 1, partial [Planctomycetes bacterium]|nr:glycosyl transferase family 1 [Planctomycetota bacterium]
MQPALRILHVLHSFPPHSRGGTERYVEQIARAQLARGAQVAVLHALDAPGARAGERVQDGLRVRWLPQAPLRG